MVSTSSLQLNAHVVGIFYHFERKHRRVNIYLQSLYIITYILLQVGYVAIQKYIFYCQTYFIILFVLVSTMNIIWITASISTRLHVGGNSVLFLDFLSLPAYVVTLNSEGISVEIIFLNGVEEQRNQHSISPEKVLLIVNIRQPHHSMAI